MRSYDEIKNIKLVHEDVTIGIYLQRLLTDLWVKGDTFSSKRPFGSSGWQYDVYAALIKAGISNGVLDEDGCVKNADIQAADEIIIGLISYIFK